MDTATCEYYLRLSESKEIPIPVFSKLLREYGSAKELLQLSRTKLENLGFDNRQIDLIQNSSPTASNENTARTMEWASKKGNYLVCYESKNYPQLLREIDSAPPILYIKGSLGALSHRHFALVGSRNATNSGRKNAYWIARELSRAGLQICSGLAMGIDSKAHEGALASGRKTVAVVATGIDRVYPLRNVQLAKQIEDSGAIVSEFPLGTPPYSGNFPRRNRIISGLAEGTLVVEANLKSGSLITARLAMEQNRDVFAIPGPIASPQSRGCHQLIKQGAKLVEGPADILEELGLVDSSINNERGEIEAAASFDLSVKEVAILEAIDYEGSLFQSIQSECSFNTQELNAKLLKLEAVGRIRYEGGRYFKSI